MKFLLFVIVLLNIFFSLKSATDIEQCNLIQGSDVTEANCNSLNTDLVDQGYKCCYIEFRVEMGQYTMCKAIQDYAQPIKDEKHRLKDYYNAKDIDIQCSSPYIKSTFGLIFILFLYIF